jgi:hypothetical protein
VLYASLVPIGSSNRCALDLVERHRFAGSLIQSQSIDDHKQSRGGALQVLQ